VRPSGPTSPGRQRWLRGLLLAGVLVGGGVGPAGVTVALAVRDTALATRFGLALAGFGAVIAGVVVMVVAARRMSARAPGESARLMLGLASVLWGISQVLIAIDTKPSGARSVGIGDLCSWLAAPVLALALFRMPRQSRASRPGLRLGLDALILGNTITLGLWWLLFQPALARPDQPGDTAVTSIVSAFFDVMFAAVGLLVWTRDRRRGALALTIGAGLQAVADVSTLAAVVGGTALPWTSGAIWSLAWPWIGLGMVQVSTAPRRADVVSVLEDLGESRATTLATVTSMALLAAEIAIDVPHRWTAIGATLFMITVILLIVREAVNSRLRSRLVVDLGTEALRDALTELPNRRALTDRIRTLDLTDPWVLLNIDLDGFKEVNDLLGPDAGDRLIVMAATVLRDLCPAAGLIARIGGDEFGLLAPGTVEDGRRLGELISRSVRKALSGSAGGMSVTASVGVGRVLPEQGPGQLPGPDGAPAADDGVDGAASGILLVDGHRDRLDALVESAAALRAAKQAGRERVEIYPGPVQRGRQRRLVLEHRLREAIAAERLTMHAQPLVDLRTGQVRGFESLARWTDDVLGPVRPDEFIPVAEQTGLVTALGEFALRSTLLQARDAGLLGQDIEIGVNVSPIQLRQRRFAATVRALVDELALNPRQLLLEVTEAILVDEGDPASGTLAELAAAGVQLAIDDFGTGYSALGYLRRLPIDMLKVDRSWVVASVSDPRTRSIVAAVVGLAHTLGATVVMEGIEDADTAAMCRDLGADLGQGWLFGRPQPWAQATVDLANSRSRHPVPQARARAADPV
jgi:diguanylate cyclase (GGDEF)-like protein